ncbi:uncharacterized protein LOC122301769 [Carya illinoinensis]|uniref:uncharacterized protein LOC122301769 n=1 Tax=Carya illinoinensis TaxID=32201 RepID=UPI001C718FC1|nr:uncharacterized protein LOC122301769 [Carya illinoinensis]
MTIAQYATRFMKLSCFTSYLILDEAKKAEKFERNLDRMIRDRDLPGLPQDREVFAIGVILGIVPISKAPYHMSPIELRELKSSREHEEHLRIALETLREKKLYAKFKKCEFWLQEITFLGHVVSIKGISVDSVMVEVMVKWAKPSNVNENGKVIAYGSRQLKHYELNYLTQDLELAVVVFA